LSSFSYIFTCLQGGRFAPEWVAGFNRNGWPVCVGITGRLGSEYSPWGELSHGGKGIREHYQEVFETDDFRTILRLLKLLADGNYRGHLPCPCGSGTIQRRCHGEKLRELMNAQSPEQFCVDVGNVLDALSKEEVKLLSLDELPQQILKDIQKKSRK